MEFAGLEVDLEHGGRRRLPAHRMRSPVFMSGKSQKASPVTSNLDHCGPLVGRVSLGRRPLIGTIARATRPAATYVFQDRSGRRRLE